MNDDWYRGRSGVPIEVLAIALIMMGVLVIVFPHLIAWFVGLVMIGVGVLWLLSAFGSRRSYAPPYDRGYPPTRPPYAPPP